MDLENANNAVDFLLVLGQYYLARIEESFNVCKSGFNPWNAKAVIGGLTGILYLLATVAFLAVLLYDGFEKHSRRNFAFLVVVVVLFVTSFLK